MRYGSCLVICSSTDFGPLLALSWQHSLPVLGVPCTHPPPLHMLVLLVC
jgi:hypothetical protein